MTDPYSAATWLEVWRWPLEAQVVLPALAAVVVHRRGLEAADAPSVARRRVQAGFFYAGIASLVAVLNSPMDSMTTTSFAWHMVQHMVLLLVVPPLVLAARPWGRLLAGLPTPVRNALGRRGDLFAGRSMAGVVRISRRIIGDSRIALGMFAGYLWIWHVPALFDATMRVGLLHDLEHLGYLGVGMVYWSRAIASPPFPAPIRQGPRAAYLLLGLSACWALGVVLTFAPSPLYDPYLAVVGATKAGVMASQITGGAIMWAPSMIPFDVVFAISVQGWLAESSRKDEEDAAAHLAAQMKAAGASR